MYVHVLYKIIFGNKFDLFCTRTLFLYSAIYTSIKMYQYFSKMSFYFTEHYEGDVDLIFPSFTLPNEYRPNDNRKRDYWPNEQSPNDILPN